MDQIPLTPEARAALEAGIQNFPFWYHRIELAEGLVTPGWAPIDPRAYQVPESLDGLRVMDVGAWDGYWSFEALRRGAREVVAIDDFSDFLGSLETRQRKGWETFDFCRATLGFGEDRCKRIEMSVYDVTEEKLGRFDVIFCFGTLYHLRHPLLALDCLGAVCDREIYIESAICDDFSPYQGGFGHGYPGNHMVMEFYPAKEYSNNATNWWAPSLNCLASMVFAAGFPKVDYWKLVVKAEQLPFCRGFVIGMKA